MYVEKLHIQNFRCFDDTEFELNYPGRVATEARPVPSRLANVNLFLGGNGTGKTSVFRALALGVLARIIRSSGFQAECLVRRNPGEMSQPPRLEEGHLHSTAKINATIMLNAMDSRSVAGTIRRSSGHIRQVTTDTIIERTGDIEDFMNGHDTDAAFWEAMYRDFSPGFFIAGYGATRRNSPLEGYFENKRSPRYRRVASLFEDQFGLTPFGYGYLQLKDAGCLDEARAILNELLPGRVSLTDQRNGLDEPLFDCDDILLPFNGLSDGYRIFIGWVWDLLYQMTKIKMEDGSRITLTDFPGVVIVDEIDLLLHPEWQRIAIDQVALMFPRIQFLFSTHSPLVAGALQPLNIYVMDDNKVEQYQEDIFGLTASQVLTSSYFGLRSTRAPNTGTLTDLAKRMHRQPNGTGHTEEAEPRDRALLAREMAREKALRMLEAIGDE